MRKMTDNGTDIIIEGYRGESVAYPKRLLQEIADLKGSYQLEDALWFYAVTKNAKSFKWVKASELVGLDTSTYEVHYFESNYEDSCWNMFDRPRGFFQYGEGSEADHMSISADMGKDSEEDGEIYPQGWTLTPWEEVLLIELSDAGIQERAAYDILQAKKNKEAEDSQEAQILRDLFPEE